jgi:hypothetical protein
MLAKIEQPTILETSFQPFKPSLPLNERICQAKVSESTDSSDEDYSHDFEAKAESLLPPAVVENKTFQKSGRGVRFSWVHIRSYSQTVGDNPAVTHGPPIQLDWDYEESEPLDIDHYEGARGKRRSMKQLSTSYYQRQNILTYFYGFSEEEVRKAKRQAKHIKRLRSMSASWSYLETALESSGRTAKLFVMRRMGPFY